MQLKVEIEDDVQEPLVTIHCKEKNAFIEQLIAAIQMVDQKLPLFLLLFYYQHHTFHPQGSGRQPQTGKRTSKIKGGTKTWQ